jgi:hypothetical protein
MPASKIAASKIAAGKLQRAKLLARMDQSVFRLRKKCSNEA